MQAAGQVGRVVGRHEQAAAGRLDQSRETTRGPAARPARRWPAPPGRTAPLARGRSSAPRARRATAGTGPCWRGRATRRTRSRRPGRRRRGVRRTLVEVRPVLRAEPAGGAQPARRRVRRLPQPDERVGQDVQPLLRRDAGEVADRVRRLGPRLAGRAVAGEVDPRQDRRRSRSAAGRGSRPCGRRSSRRWRCSRRRAGRSPGSARWPAARCSGRRASRKMSSPWR